MDLLADIPSIAWVAVLTPIVVALFAAFGRSPVRPGADGWVRLRPPLVLYLIGLLCVPLAVVFTMLPAAALAADDTADAIVVLVVGPLMAAFLWYVIYAFLVVGTRFNAEGMEYRGCLKTLFVPWTDVRRINYHGFWGPYLSTSRGGLIVSMYFKGFRQFIEEAARHGIEIDPGLPS